jgi:hypothetical protein
MRAASGSGVSGDTVITSVTMISAAVSSGRGRMLGAAVIACSFHCAIALQEKV